MPVAKRNIEDDADDGQSDADDGDFDYECSVCGEGTNQRDKICDECHEKGDVVSRKRPGLDLHGRPLVKSLGGGGGSYVDTPEGIELYRILTLKQALKLEIKGMKLSRGINAATIVKREFGFKGNKKKLLEQLEAYIAARFPKRENPEVADDELLENPRQRKDFDLSEVSDDEADADACVECGAEDPEWEDDEGELVCDDCKEADDE